jgi:hypothetical protein
MTRVPGCKSCWPYYRKAVPIIKDGARELCAVCGRVLCIRYSGASLTILTIRHSKRQTRHKGA